jgi:hypothetical protein
MKKFNFLFLLASYLLVVLAGCRRNEVSNTNPEAPVDDAITVNASITGMVVNENNVPVAGVQVQSGSNSATTNANGIFQFRNITMSKNNAVVKVVRNGYFTAFRTFPATPGRNHQVRIKLIPKTNAGNFNGNSGGTINIAGGGKMVMPANAVTDAAGNAYNGVVNVAMTWINPNAPDLGSTIPGDLRGVTTNGQERVLETYGMLGVELTGSGGQALKIASGKKAELSFPLPAGAANAPATIPLWHFDEAKARWVEEGSATKVGNFYVGQVSHFSFWNCDQPFSGVTLCITVQNASGQPIPNTYVRLTRVTPGTSWPTAGGVTDSSGSVCGLVPKNEALILDILNLCGTVIYTQNIGPFSVNTSLPPITINTNNTGWLNVSGQVLNCTNSPVTNGYVLVTYNGGYYTQVPVNNGNFTANIFNCTGNTISLALLPVDNTTGQQGNPFNASGNTGNLTVGPLIACGTTIQEFYNLTVDGVPYNFTAADSLRSNIFGGTASVSAQRFNGGVSQGSSVTFSYVPTNLGSFSMQTLSVFLGNNNASQTISSANPVVNVTECGPVLTGFLAGNFSVQMQFSTTPTTRTVAGQFRVRRF